MWPSTRKIKMEEWEANVLNYAADMLNAQREHFMLAQISDPMLIEYVAGAESADLDFYEMAFLWGFFNSCTKVYPSKLNEVDATKRLMEMRWQLRGANRQQAAQFAARAEVFSNRQNDIFDLLVDIGTKAPGNRELFVDAMTEFFRMLAKRQKR